MNKWNLASAITFTLFIILLSALLIVSIIQGTCTLGYGCFTVFVIVIDILNAIVYWDEYFNYKKG